MVSRFELGKNCEYALEVCRKLADRYPLELILMGDFEPHTTDISYQEQLRRMIKAYEAEPWFRWEPTLVPYPQVLEAYNRFDLCIQLSGAEAGSNSIVELLGMGKPVIALNASTNPYLFQGWAYLVEADLEDRPGQLSYQVPRMDCLEEAVEALVCEGALRAEWGRKGQELARRRFHPSLARQRVALLFAEEPHLLRQQFDQDRREYAL